MSSLSEQPIGSGMDASGSAHTFVGGKRVASEVRDAKLQDGQASANNRASASQAPLIVRSRNDLHDELERYEEKEEIGRGGCGVVLRAFDRHMQRDVVIKRVLANAENTKETVARFLNEARITGRLEHPGIVPVHEIGHSRSDDSPFYVMKWVQGITLSQLISDYHSTAKNSDKHRKFHELLTRFHQICQTLAYVHGMKIIHRDLKPANIMIGQFGETVILDWGLAKELDRAGRPLQASADAIDNTTLGSSQPKNASDDSAARKRSKSFKNRQSKAKADGLTQIGAVMGTAAYMSPEQARGESSKVDSRSDVFSLGIILYEILSGVSPFRSTCLQTTLSLVARADYKQLRKLDCKVPRALDAICHRAMQLRPEDRYSDASELAIDIASFLSGDSVKTYREPWWGRIDRIAGKHRTLVRSAFLAMFAVAMVSIIGAAKIDVARRAETSARRLAENEANQKVAAYEQERIAHDRSLNQLRAARKSVDAWLIDLSGDLQFYPGLTTLRNQLLVQATRYYETNIESAGKSELDMLEIARSKIRLGDIARMTNDISNAQDLYASAGDLLASQATDSSAFSVQKANALLGQALSALESEDGPVETMRLAHVSAQAAAHAISIEANRDAKKTWIRSQLCLAKAMAKNGQHVEGAILLEQPIAMADLLWKDEPDPNGFQLLTNLLSLQAGLYETSSQWEPAIESLQRLAQLFSNRIRNDEPRPDWFESRSHAHSRLGKCYGAMQKPLVALEEYASADEDMQTAWKRFYDGTYFSENLAISSANLGNAMSVAGERTQAEAKLRAAISQLQEVIRHDGSNSDRVGRMANLFLSLAATLEDRTSDEFQKLLRDSRTLIDHLKNATENLNELRQLEQEWSILNANVPAFLESSSSGK